MGLLDSIVGGLLGGATPSSPMQSILASVLGGGGTQGNTQPGIGGLIQRFAQAGYGDAAQSWVGNGPNQPISPSALQNVFGHEQINQWAQQSGMQPQNLLGELAQFLPHAIDRMTPNGTVPEGPSGSGSPFDDAGVELPQR